MMITATIAEKNANTNHADTDTETWFCERYLACMYMLFHFVLWPLTGPDKSIL